MLEAVMKPEDVIDQLRAFGLRLFIGEDGIVHGKFRQSGQHVTLEMRPVIDQLQLMNNDVADLLRREEEYVGMHAEQVISEIGPRVQSGEVELVGKLIYHKGSALCDLIVRRKAAPA